MLTKLEQRRIVRKLAQIERDQMRAEIERLQAENRELRLALIRYQEDETNHRMLEQAKKRAAAEGMMGPLPEREGKQ